MAKEVIRKIRDIVDGLSKDLNQVRMKILVDAAGHIKQARTIDDQIAGQRYALELEEKVSDLRTNILNLIENELKSFENYGHIQIPRKIGREQTKTPRKMVNSSNGTRFHGRSVRRFSKNCWTMDNDKVIFVSRKGNKSISIETVIKTWGFLRQIGLFNFTDLINAMRKSTQEEPVIIDEKPVPSISGNHALAVRFLDSFGFIKRLRRSKKTSGKRLFKVFNKTNKELEEVISSLRRS